MRKCELLELLKAYPDNAEISIDDHEHRDYCKIDEIRYNNKSNIIIIGTVW